VDLGSYPGALPPESEADWIRGEFFRLRDIGGALEELDRYEGFRDFDRGGSLFRRTVVRVDVGDGRIRRA
jgi:hypothetical protein